MVARDHGKFKFVCALPTSADSAPIEMSDASTEDQPLLLDHSAHPMADTSHSKGLDHAHWTIEEERALIFFLVQHKAEDSDGFNFKKATWQTYDMGFWSM